MLNDGHTPNMASEPYRLSSRMRFLMGEIDVLEAQLEHRRSDLNDVIQRMEQLMLAQANGDNPPTTPLQDHRGLMQHTPNPEPRPLRHHNAVLLPPEKSPITPVVTSK